MSTSPVKSKTAAPKRQPNFLEQIGKTLNNMMGGNAAAAPAPKPANAPKPRSTPPRTPPAAKKDAVRSSGSANPAARPPVSNKVSTASKPTVRSGDFKPGTSRASDQQRTVPTGAVGQKPVVTPTTAQKPAVASRAVKPAATAPGTAPKEVYGPAAPSLASAEKRVSDYSKSYDKEAEGKSGFQKSLDAGRKFVNEGYGDDMFKNNGKSAKAIAEVKAQLKNGKITEAQATRASSTILANFERERVRVTGAQANNAQIGKGVQGAGRVVTVAGAAIGGTMVAGPVGGVAAATVAGSAYDAASKLDQGSARFSAQFDVSNSVGGVLARKIKGEKVNGGDWARGVAGSGADAISGAFTGGTMISAKAAQTALLTVARQTGAKVTLTAMAKAAAMANIKTNLVQTAATTGYKTLTIVGDGSLTAKEQRTQVIDNVIQNVKQAPVNTVFGAAAAFTGVKIRLDNKVADMALQYGMDVVSNGAQKSLENFIAKKGAGLSTEDMAVVLTQSAGGTLNNMVQRLPLVNLAGVSNAPTVRPNPTQTGRTPTGQTVRLRPVGPLNGNLASVKPVSKDTRAALTVNKAAKNLDVSVQVPKPEVKPGAKTESVPGPLSSADEARLNDARRMEHNPFMPGDSPFDARGRLREGFSHKDFVEGSSTMRMSQDPLGETPHSPPAVSAKLKPDQPLDVSKWNLPMSKAVFGRQPVQGSVWPGLEARPLQPRPLPPAVGDVARRLGLPVADVQRLRDALGGTFGARDAVNHLQNRSNSPLDASQATELVKEIRRSQSASTRVVTTVIDAALAREVLPGKLPSVFNKVDWDTIEPLLNAQPALDNAAARRLRSLLVSGRVDPQAKGKITNYLKSVGDEFTVPAGRSPTSEAVPTSNLSTTDASFAKLLIAAGQTKAQVNVGVVDHFDSATPGPSVLFNSKAMPPATDYVGSEHGDATTAVVGKAGRWANITTLMVEMGVHGLAGSLDRLVADNARVINISLGWNRRDRSYNVRPEALASRAAFARHPDVLFVQAAGNEGANTARMLSALSFAAGMPNVMYVGNVDAAGNLAKSSTHGKTVDIYAPGVDRQVARGPGKAYNVQSGTSISAPEVASLAAKMLVLCPKLKPAAVREIIQQTASAPPIGAADIDGSVARAGILNGDAATKVAALMTIAQRVGSLERAASALTLSAPERSRLIPIAQRQMSLAAGRERSQAQTSGTGPSTPTGRRPAQTTTPSEVDAVRVHHPGGEMEHFLGGEQLSDKQISRLAGGTDATLIDVHGSGRDLHVYAASKSHDAAVELYFPHSETKMSILREPGLWRAGTSDKRLAAKAETRAVAIMAAQAQALGLKSISIEIYPGSQRAAEWAKRGFSVALPNNRGEVEFDLTSGSRSWKQLVKQVKSLGIELPAGLPADGLLANDAATRGLFRKFLGR